MATNAKWTVVFDDKLVIKNYDEGATQGIGYPIEDDAFWSDPKFSNIWAIQYGTAVSSDEVEYRDTTPHTSYADANLGDISQFSNKWDAVHLPIIQDNWDKNNINNPDGSPIEETEAEKIARLGPRPTSYSSS
tara:strand:+ start:158 stop:556 length:399 start_codon:yes stop_codon:yes gene_type:complete